MAEIHQVLWSLPCIQLYIMTVIHSPVLDLIRVAPLCLVFEAF